MNKELLELLINTPSPSGYELDLQKKLIDYMKDVDDFVITNQDYTVVHGINKDAKTKLLFAAHIDEIGLAINKVLPNGTCKVEAIGGARPYMYAGQHVRVLNNNKEIPGVFGYLPNMDKGIKIDDLVLDLGTSSREETLKLINIGNPVIHQMNYSYLANNRFAGRALDDKLAVYIFLEALKRVKGKTNLGIYVATTPGEETTGRGAKSAVSLVKPNVAIACDVTYAADLNYKENLHGEIALGSGAVLTEGSLMNKKIHSMFKETATKNQIKIQYEVAPCRTFTDTDSMFDYNGSTPAYLISIPLRYMHSSVEVVDLNDVEEIIKLVEAFILNFDEHASLNPFE